MALNSEKVHLGMGLVIGVVVTIAFIHFYAPRYEMSTSGEHIIRHDKWSGDSWRFSDNQWKKITDAKRDWQEVDAVLRQALQIPTEAADTEHSLRLLKGKYAILRDLSDEELLERIKIVYSREILTSLYLSHFMKREDGARVAPGTK
jgi:hypothetical protein